MSVQGMAALLSGATAEGLKELVQLKGRLDELMKRKKALEKGLAEIDREIRGVEQAVIRVARREVPAAVLRGLGGIGSRRRRRRRAQPSLYSVIAEVLREKGRPMNVAEIAAAVREEKGYRSRARDFKGQVRILLYKNEKGLFKKIGSGLFTYADVPGPGG